MQIIHKSKNAYTVTFGFITIIIYNFLYIISYIVTIWMLNHQ
jgi:hypothetical protein